MPTKKSKPKPKKKNVFVDDEAEQSGDGHEDEDGDGDENDGDISDLVDDGEEGQGGSFYAAVNNKLDKHDDKFILEAQQRYSNAEEKANSDYQTKRSITKSKKSKQHRGAPEELHGRSGKRRKLRRNPKVNMDDSAGDGDAGEVDTAIGDDDGDVGEVDTAIGDDDDDGVGISVIVDDAGDVSVGEASGKSDKIAGKADVEESVNSGAASDPAPSNAQPITSLREYFNGVKGSASSFGQKHLHQQTRNSEDRFLLTCEHGAKFRPDLVDGMSALSIISKSTIIPPTISPVARFNAFTDVHIAGSVGRRTVACIDVVGDDNDGAGAADGVNADVVALPENWHELFQSADISQIDLLCSSYPDRLHRMLLACLAGLSAPEANDISCDRALFFLGMRSVGRLVLTSESATFFSHTVADMLVGGPIEMHQPQQGDENGSGSRNGRGGRKQNKAISAFDRLKIWDTRAVIVFSEVFDGLGANGTGIDENMVALVDPSTLAFRAILKNDSNQGSRIVEAVTRRLKCISCTREIAELTLKAINALSQRLVERVHSDLRSRLNRNEKMTIHRYQYVNQIIKDARGFKPTLSTLRLPSGKPLAAPSGKSDYGSNQTILGDAVERSLALAQSAGLKRGKGRDVLGRLRVGSTAFIGTKMTRFILGEDLDPHPSRAERPAELEQDRKLRLMIQPFARASSGFMDPSAGDDNMYDISAHDTTRTSLLTDAIFDTGFMGPVFPVEQLVALAHADTSSSAAAGAGGVRVDDNAAFKAFCNNASIHRLAPDILASMCSARFPDVQKADRSTRAFLDGMIDVSVDPLTFEATSPIIVCQRSQTQWANFLAHRKKKAKGQPVKFYPYTLSGKPSSGIRASLDAEMDHRYPIAVRYRSIVTRQPGDMLTHAYNVYMDGALMYEKNAVEKTQMCKILIGNAKTGKSTQVDVVTDLYPSEATGNISGNESVFGLQDFGPEKMLAYAQEMGPNMAVSSTDLQSAISADRVRVSVKHGLAREFWWLIPIVLAGNLLGPWRDTNGSLLRRFLMFMYLFRYEEDQNGDIKSELREDIGPTIMCMFTTFLHVIWSRAQWARQAPAGVIRSKDQDMFAEPAPPYFLRTRLEYGHQISRTLALMDKNRNSLVFIPTEACHLDDVVTFMNNGADSSGGDISASDSRGGRKDKIDQTTVRSCLLIMGCHPDTNGRIQGLQIRREPDGARSIYVVIDSTIRLAALLATGYAWVLNERKRQTKQDIPFPTSLATARNNSESITMWSGKTATDENYSYALMILKQTEAHLRVDLTTKNKEVDHAALEVALWDLEEMQKASSTKYMEKLLNAIKDLYDPKLSTAEVKTENMEFIVTSFIDKARMKVLFPELLREPEAETAKLMWDCTSLNISPTFLPQRAHHSPWGGKVKVNVEHASSLALRVFADVPTRDLQ